VAYNVPVYAAAPAAAATVGNDADVHPCWHRPLCALLREHLCRDGGGALSEADDALLFGALDAPEQQARAATDGASQWRRPRAQLCWDPWPEAAAADDALGGFWYRLLTVRLDALARVCAALDAEQRCDENDDDDDDDDELCVLAHYAHAYLDAHLSLALAVERERVPTDAAQRAALVRACVRPLGAFTLAQLPDALLDALERCAFFAPHTAAAAAAAAAAADDDVAALQAVFERLVPVRCETRDMLLAVRRLMAVRGGTHFVCAALALAVLGACPAAAARPPVAVRLAVYRDVFGHDTDAAAASVRRLVDAAVAAPRGAAAEALCSALRECMCAVLRHFSPALHAELCARTRWRHWQRDVSRYADALRRRLAPAAAGAEPWAWLAQWSTAAAAAAAPAAAPPPPCNALYAWRREPFWSTLASECARELDVHGAADRVPDALFTREHAHALRAVLHELCDAADAPRGPRSLRRAARGGGGDAWWTWLAVFGATPVVLRELAAARREHAQRAGTNRQLVGGLVRWLATESLYQLVLVHELALACVERTRVYALPLAAHLRAHQEHALRARFGVDGAPHVPTPQRALVSFVCTVCGGFCAALVKHADMVSAVDVTSGAQHVARADDCAAARYARARLLRDTLLPLPAPAPCTLFEYYARDRDAVASPYPADPDMFDAPASARHDPRLLRLLRPPLAYAPLPAPPAAAEPLPRLPGAVRDHYWVCASRHAKTERRKTRGGAAAPPAPAPAAAARAASERRANEKRRHDMRMLHVYSRCAETQLLEVNMLGTLLMVHGRAYMACAACLSYMDVATARHRRGDMLVCARCDAAEDTRGRAAAARSRANGRGGHDGGGGGGGGGVVTCRACGRACVPGADGCRGTVAFDDLRVDAERFVDVYLCGRHARRAAWLWAAPNYHALSTVDMGLRVHWRTLGAWNPRRNYLADFVRRVDAGAPRPPVTPRRGHDDDDDDDSDDDVAAAVGNATQRSVQNVAAAAAARAR